MLSLLRLERKQTNSSNLFRIRIFLFLSFSFGIDTINTFIHSRSSPEKHTRFQTKMDKVYPRFQTKTAQKPYPMGSYIPTYLYSLYKGVPPPPGRWLAPHLHVKCGKNLRLQQFKFEDLFSTVALFFKRNNVTFNIAVQKLTKQLSN